MKWSNRIGQGFSLAWTGRKAALKVATEWRGLELKRDVTQRCDRLGLDVVLEETAPLGRHFQGVFWVRVTQG
jgi:hypothetical protein